MIYEQERSPMNDGEEVEGKITSVGEKGDGILKVNGYTIFVPQTDVGEYVKVRITKALPKFAFAEIVE